MVKTYSSNLPFAKLMTVWRKARTNDILAPDTAMLKPVCHFPCPFDTPLILGLNFLRISDEKNREITAQETKTLVLLQSNSAI